MGKYDPNCPVCGMNLIEVSRVYSVPFYACHNEDCEDYAVLKINVGDYEKPFLVGYHEMIDRMSEMAEGDYDYIDEQPLLGNDTEEHF